MTSWPANSARNRNAGGRNSGHGRGSWTLLTGHGHVLVEITRNRYTVNPDSLFRHPAQDGHQVGPFLALLAASGNVVTGGGVSR